MSVVRAKQTLRKQVNLAWTELTSSVTQMAAGCDVRPNAGSQVFAVDQGDDETMKVLIKPVAFRLKEKAQDDRADMFVTVQGKVNFSIDSDMATPLACHFATEVGYFRGGTGKGFVDHVLGIHYDYDNRRAGHPVFHAQLTSCVGHLAIVNDHYRPELQVRSDLMKGIANRVRLPTAHMDPLAVFVQLLADHLLNENSGPVETSAFERARSALMFFKSDPRRSQRLDEVRAEQCFRGPRWYPLPQSAATPATL
jgi:hypothetical protein